ncbi:MAG: hypothetical protein QG599_3062 [Pseudomonadota bacterium]|nr:hypothetical protein [Pseudomonadota bacterium]
MLLIKKLHDITIAAEFTDDDQPSLRERAEALLAQSRAKQIDLSSEAIERLIHDLSVHQIELELQNEELRNTQRQLQDTRDRYAQLYHQAPVGYLTLGANGIIQRANQTLCTMLDADLAHLTGSALVDFMAGADREIFLGRFKAFFQHPAGKSITTRLYGKKQRNFAARLTGRQEISATPSASGSVPRLLIAVNDISELVETDQALRRSRALLQARLQLSEFAFQGSLDDLLQKALDTAEQFTHSQIGFFHFVAPDQETLTLQAWSTHTLQSMCTAEGQGQHYSISEAGVWVDCIRQRRPVIHNDYPNLPDHKGLPQGHAPIVRELTVPVVRNGLITAVIGVGNKPKNYTAEDVEVVDQIASMIMDIAERKQAEVQLRLAAVAFETAEAMFVTDQNGAIEQVNRAFTRLTGYAPEEAIGQNPRLLRSGRHEADFYATLWHHLLTEGRWSGEIWNRHRDGKMYPQWESITAVHSDQGTITHFVATCIDLTQQKAAQETIRRLAFYDPLTELPNRRLFLDRLSRARAIAHREGRHGALLLVDLDAFKRLNDACGHETGDRLLQEVAARLVHSLREEDTVARLGSDEFALLLANLSSSTEEAGRAARHVAEKVRQVIALPFLATQSEYHVGASIGITLFPADGETANDLLKQADTALYQAKAAGRNRVRFFEAAMQSQIEARFALEGELRQALVRDELRLYFQPQVDEAGRIVGAEALLRWQNPLRGLVSPMDFIPLAEEAGFIVPMGEWVLAEVCRVMTRLTAAGRSLRLALNVSPRQFRQPGFVRRAKAILMATNADPTCLTLEVTEGLVIDDLVGTIAKMNELKAMGMQLSIDDFGTGYSSLAYLKRLPIDELKIDRSFVQDATTDASDAALVEAILAVAQHLQLAVVAEGVETTEQATFLKDRGCVLFQGYLYGKPQPAEAFLQSLLTVQQPVSKGR